MTSSTFSEVEGLPAGAYDQLITAGLAVLIDQTDLPTSANDLDPAEATDVLAAHLETVATRVLGPTCSSTLATSRPSTRSWAPRSPRLTGSICCAPSSSGKACG